MYILIFHISYDEFPGFFYLEKIRQMAYTLLIFSLQKSFGTYVVAREGPSTHEDADKRDGIYTVNA